MTANTLSAAARYCKKRTARTVSIDLYADEPINADKFIKNGRCCRFIAKSCPINVNSLETAMHSIRDGTFAELVKDSRKIGMVIENDKLGTVDSMKEHYTENEFFIMDKQTAEIYNDIKHNILEEFKIES